MNRQEATELLPWFVAGTLSEDESMAVQAFVDSGEISAAELDELRVFRDSVIDQSASEPAYDPTILERAMSQLDTVPQLQREEPLVVPEAPSSSRDPEPVGLLDRLLERLQWSATPPLAKLAIGAQFALLLGLALVLGGGESGGVSPYETVSGSATGSVRADLVVSFAAGATETDLRALLLETEIVIVEGPSALGFYRLRSDSVDPLDSVRQVLEDSALTTFVQLAAPDQPTVPRS